MKKGNKRFKKFVADDYEARKSERKAQKENKKETFLLTPFQKKIAAENIAICHYHNFKIRI